MTTIDVHGRDNDRSMLIMTMQRKRLPEALATLEEHCNGAVVTVTDIKTQRGGYLERAMRAANSETENKCSCIPTAFGRFFVSGRQS